MYFHLPFRADDWLLYCVRGSINYGGRGLGLGQLFDKEGRLVVSTVQEGLLRYNVSAPNIFIFHKNEDKQNKDNAEEKEERKSNL